MARKVENDKGFLVLKVDTDDFRNIGSPGRCDSCYEKQSAGFYVAVLNSILCEDCYKDWLKVAIRYGSDKAVETKRYNLYKKAFNNDNNNFHIQ